MFAPRLARGLGAVGLVFLAGSAACSVEDDGPRPLLVGEQRAELSEAVRLQRLTYIKEVAESRGFVGRGFLWAGIAQSETGLAHCNSEVGYGCPGPGSPDCGGGPVLAGGGDGPCAGQNGGLGMFQFDAGTYSQTIAQYSSDVLTVKGNVNHAVDFVINMVGKSKYINVGAGGAVQWLKSFDINNPTQRDQWIKTVTHYYNGCRPSICKVYNQRYASYNAGLSTVVNETGIGFWQKPQCQPHCEGTTMIAEDCSEGPCGAFGSTCVNDSLGLRCVAPGCKATGTQQFCDGTQLATCKNGALGKGDCAKFAAKCVETSATQAECQSLLCPQTGTTKGCLDEAKIITCKNGQPEIANCGAYGAICSETGGAHCVAPYALSLVKASSDAAKDTEKKADYEVCAGAAVETRFEVENTGYLTWIDVGGSEKKEPGMRMRLATRVAGKSDQPDAFLGVGRVSVKNATNPEVVFEGKDCSDKKGCRRTTFVLAGSAPETEGVYESTWHLIDEGLIDIKEPSLSVSYRVKSCPLPVDPEPAGGSGGASGEGGASGSGGGTAGADGGGAGGGTTAGAGGSDSPAGGQGGATTAKGGSSGAGGTKDVGSSRPTAPVATGDGDGCSVGSAPARGRGSMPLLALAIAFGAARRRSFRRT